MTSGAPSTPRAPGSSRVYEGPKAAARVRALVSRLDAQASLYEVAVLTLAADKAGALAEPAIAETLSPHHDALTKAFLGEDDARIAVEDAWRYPLHTVGAQAILGRAAFVAGANVSKVSMRLRALFTSTSLSTFDRATLVLAALPG